MTDIGMQQQARHIVYTYAREHLDKTDDAQDFSPEEVYVVWFCKTLQNWKALVSTTLPDGQYFEVTHDGDKGQTYVDVYKKWENFSVPDGS